MIMQKSATGQNRPLETKYASRELARAGAETKCRLNKKPYIVLEAIEVCDVPEYPLEWVPLKLGEGVKS
jgi:hypothetical protein